MKKIQILNVLTVIIMNQENVKAQSNPLLGAFNTPHETAPFEKIKKPKF